MVLAILLPLVFRSAEQHFLLSRVAIYAMIALSVTVLTGWNGQLSLGQFAFVGIGAFVTAGLVERSVPFGFAVVWATGAGVIAALLVGFPALRIRGLLLAITTLAFALAAKGWLFPRLAGDTAAVFVPRGLAGPLYWCAVAPFHGLVFGSMIRNIGRASTRVG